MSTYSVTLVVRTDIQLGDDHARDVAARWAAAAGFDLGMTSTSRDEPWLRVAGMIEVSEQQPDPAAITAAAAGHLVAELADTGARVATWLTVELAHEDEFRRRARVPAIPPMVTAAELAELAGVSSVQRIYQLESERKGGKRADFPAPVLDGYWLRSAAEHWAATRRRKPGPAPRS